MTFYLGVHRPRWLSIAGVPLFVSRRTLEPYKTLPRAIAPWALDSGGFTELSTYGEWVTTPREYVGQVRRFRDEVGMMQWAAPQDWMNEPAMLARTGLSVIEHQKRTVENLLGLRALAPDLPFIPVLQGWEPDDYLACVEMYANAGVNLSHEPVVGVGTVCRRQDKASGLAVLQALAPYNLNLHGFGVKATGLRAFGELLSSSDSMAWSYNARRNPDKSTCAKTNCANCLHFALEWRGRLLASGVTA